MELNVRGFTVIELMVTVALAVALLGMSVMGFRAITAKTRARTYATNLARAIALARSEAVKGGLTTVICPCRDDACSGCVDPNPTPPAGQTIWQRGWLVAGVNNRIYRVWDGVNETTNITINGNLDTHPNVAGVPTINIQPTGFRPPGSQNIDFIFTPTLCEGFQPRRRVRIEPSGKVVITPLAC